MAIELDAAFEVLRESILRDIETAKDRLSLSRWVAGFGAAALGIVVIKGEELKAALGSPVLVVVTSGLVVFGTLFGGLVHRYVNKGLRVKRNQLALVAFQVLRIKQNPELLPAAVGDEGIEIIDHLVNEGRYLAEKHFMVMPEAKKEDDKAKKDASTAFSFQVILTGGGYFMMVVCSLLKLTQ